MWHKIAHVTRILRMGTLRFTVSLYEIWLFCVKYISGNYVVWYFFIHVTCILWNLVSTSGCCVTCGTRWTDQLLWWKQRIELLPNSVESRFIFVIQGPKLRVTKRPFRKETNDEYFTISRTWYIKVIYIGSWPVSKTRKLQSYCVISLVHTVSNQQ